MTKFRFAQHSENEKRLNFIVDETQFTYMAFLPRLNQPETLRLNN